jgi:hypothetical protein
MYAKGMRGSCVCYTFTHTLVSQTVIPGRGKFGGAAPYAFTEQGRDSARVALLENVRFEVKRVAAASHFT